MTESNDIPAILDRITQARCLRLLHAAMGLVTESGEFMDAMKKHIFYGKPIDSVNLVEELGDGDWYKALALDELDVSMFEMWVKNIKKLRLRYAGRFGDTQALNRNLEAERRILEGEDL